MANRGRTERGAKGSLRASVPAALAALCWFTPAAAQVARPAVGRTVDPAIEEPRAAAGIDVAPPTLFADEALRSGFPAELLVVLDPSTDRALLVDPSARSVLARLPTGAAPRELAVSADGRSAYVANYGLGTGSEGEVVGSGDGSPEGTVTVLDLRTGFVIRTLRPFRVAAGRARPSPFRRLHAIRLGEHDRRLWLTAESDSAVVEMDAATGEVLMVWKTGGGMGHTMVVSSSGRRLFVANRASESVTVLDRRTVVAHRIPTGSRPEGLALSPTGRELWVGNRGDHTLTVIDVQGHRALATLEAGGMDPVRLAFRPDGSELWVVNRESRELAVFDARTREVLDRVSLDVPPFGIAFSGDGSRAYVSAPEAGRVVVVDALRRHVLDALQTGGRPHGLAWIRPGDVGPLSGAP